MRNPDTVPSREIVLASLCVMAGFSFGIGALLVRQWLAALIALVLGAACVRWFVFCVKAVAGRYRR